jgi:sugar phosphate permease
MLWYCLFRPVHPSENITYHSIILKDDLGFSVKVSLILIAPPAIFAVLAALLASYWADKVRYRSPFIFIQSFIAIVGFILLIFELPVSVRLLGIFLAVGGASINQPSALAFAQNNIIGTSKRAVASALQVGFGGIGGIAASTVFRQQDNPRYVPGYALIYCTLLIIDWCHVLGLKLSPFYLLD